MPTLPIKTVIIIAGPTGVGKTSVAVTIAQHFQTEIISADSRQCFKELNIGVARPSYQELQAVKHYFIASHSIREEITAADFEQYALTVTRELFRKHDIILMEGGTGLYIKAFCEGLDEIPAIDPRVREKIRTVYDEKGINWLLNEMKEKDPAYYKSGEMQNPQRMMRALEVIMSTGESILSFQKGSRAKREFKIIRIGLELPREELTDRINIRVDKMMEAGLLNEVKSLMPSRELNALQTVGYKELFDYLDGKIKLDETIRQIKTNTRQYAKRQMTWFRKDKDMNWFHPGEINKIVSFIEGQLNSREGGKTGSDT